MTDVTRPVLRQAEIDQCPSSLGEQRLHPSIATCRRLHEALSFEDTLDWSRDGGEDPQSPFPSQHCVCIKSDDDKYWVCMLVVLHGMEITFVWRYA